MTVQRGMTSRSGKIRFALAAALLAALSACSKPAVPAKPALWEVTGPQGEHGYLFGTIHALPREVDWQSQRIRQSLGKADRLVLEIRQLDDPKAMQAIFTRLSVTPGQAPLAQKVAPRNREKLKRLMQQAGVDEAQFANQETWAAALTLAQFAEGKPVGEGVDRALMAMAQGKPVEELEGTQAQLSLFDTLPEKEQRDLLDSIVAEAASASGEERRIEALWRSGDMSALARETSRGMLADPELRQVLLVGRNQKWADAITAMLKARQRPFVAVGAAHLAGHDGLPDLLAARGYTVRRLQ